MSVPDKIDFAKLCKETRAAYKLTQQQMADKLGVQARSYQRYEAGEAEPTAQVAVKVYIMHLEASKTNE